MLKAKNSGVTRWSGGTAVLKAGQTIDEDHPLAKERPDLFEKDTQEPDIKTAPEGRTRHRSNVETAAATGPGGRRMIRRGSQTGE